ncbi:MAG: hypothetical protein DRH37_00770 [Deltaproteobacteria bacterium]|nr:MAG: hypothetical protein DRH37_00770 [Deltaproteobacteria bacterium]
MRSKHDGIPAFPEACNGQIFSGMTLIDWFAGQAMTGVAITDEREDKVAEWAYGYARAMIDERAKLRKEEND